MRAPLLAGWGALAIAAGACAASGDKEAEGTDPGPREAVIPEAGAPVDAGADASVSVDGPACSEAGWCETTLPDADLVMLDLWPLPGRAFAIANSPTIGIKVLEWNEEDAKWGYIDDATQNAPEVGTFAGRIWAPNDDEVYFGVGPGYVYRGTRPVPPASAWSWTRFPLADNGRPGSEPDPKYAQMSGRRYPALGVWGTSKDDVYAWFKNTIFRLKGSGGTVDWEAEHIAEDTDADAGPANEHLYFVSAAGTSAGDVWFSGARAQPSRACALVVRKTAAGYERVADGVVSAAGCAPIDGALMIGGAEGWLTDLQAVAPGELIGLKGARDPVKVSVEGDGYAVAVSPLSTTSIGLPSATFRSLWSASGSLWLATNRMVVRGTDVWTGGQYAISTLALNGAPLPHDLYEVRGTSNTNLWAIGDRHALHKTTP